MYWIDVVFLKFISSVRQKFQRGDRGKMALVAVEAVPTDSEPPTLDDNMRTSTGGRLGFGASAPLLTKTSPMHFSGARGGSATSSKLVKLVGPT